MTGRSPGAPAEARQKRAPRKRTVHQAIECGQAGFLDALCAVLAQPPLLARLEHLNLSFNMLDVAACAAIREALVHNRTLLGLHLEGSCADVDAAGFVRTHAPGTSPPVLCDRDPSEAFAELAARPWPKPEPRSGARPRPSGQTSVTSRSGESEPGPKAPSDAWTPLMTCWVCAQWTSRRFSVCVPATAGVVRLHTSFERPPWRGTELTATRASAARVEDDGVLEFAVERACPPGESAFFFSVDGVLLLGDADRRAPWAKARASRLVPAPALVPGARQRRTACDDDELLVNVCRQGPAGELRCLPREAALCEALPSSGEADALVRLPHPGDPNLSGSPNLKEDAGGPEGGSSQSPSRPLAWGAEERPLQECFEMDWDACEVDAVLSTRTEQAKSRKIMLEHAEQLAAAFRFFASLPEPKPEPEPKPDPERELKLEAPKQEAPSASPGDEARNEEARSAADYASVLMSRSGFLALWERTTDAELCPLHVAVAIFEASLVGQRRRVALLLDITREVADGEMLVRQTKAATTAEVRRFGMLDALSRPRFLEAVIKLGLACFGEAEPYESAALRRFMDECFLPKAPRLRRGVNDASGALRTLARANLPVLRRFFERHCDAAGGMGLARWEAGLAQAGCLRSCDAGGDPSDPGGAPNSDLGDGEGGGDGYGDGVCPQRVFVSCLPHAPHDAPMHVGYARLAFDSFLVAVCRLVEDLHLAQRRRSPRDVNDVNNVVDVGREVLHDLCLASHDSRHERLVGL